MAITTDELIVIIFNFVPIAQIPDAITDISISGNVSYDIQESTQSDGFSLIGSQLVIKNVKAKKLFYSQKTSSRFSLSFEVSNTESGKILAKTLFQFDSMIRAFANIPCQLIGLGNIMLLGRVKNSDSNISQFSDRWAFSYEFEEQTVEAFSNIKGKVEVPNFGVTETAKALTR